MFTVGITCNAWKIETDLKLPTATSDLITGTLDSNGFCQFLADLVANTAYGLSIAGANINIGMYAPIGL